MKIFHSEPSVWFLLLSRLSVTCSIPRIFASPPEYACRRTVAKSGTAKWFGNWETWLHNSASFLCMCWGICMPNSGLQHHVVSSSSLLMAGGRWETGSTESVGGWSWRDCQNITPLSHWHKGLPWCPRGVKKTFMRCELGPLRIIVVS